jgi:hypothetical protein
MEFLGLLHVPDILQASEAEDVAIRVPLQKVGGFLIEVGGVSPENFSDIDGERAIYIDGDVGEISLVV